MFAKLLSFLGLSKNRVTDEEWDEEELQQIQRVYKEAISSDIEAIDHVDVFVNNLLVNNSLIPFPDWPSYGVTLKLIRKVYSEKRSHSLSILNATTVDIRLLNESPTLVAFFRSYPDANYKDHNLASKIVVQADGVIVPIED